MLVYYFVYVNGTVEKVAHMMTDSPGKLTVWAKLAYESGEELRTRIKPGSWIPAKEIELIVGKPTPRPGAIHVPIAWKATGTDLLFPVLEADLIIEAIGDDATQVTLRGSYTPPLGPVGRLLDRAVLHRIAEACVKNFMDRMEGALNQPSPEVAVAGAR